MKPENLAKHEEACAALKARFAKHEIDGPWMHEPNRLNWKHAGMDCMIVRNHTLGFLCGYVGVPPEHPLHGKDYSSDEASHLEAHGGLTFSDGCSDFICHTPEPGDSDNTWWFGFDCGHCYDLAPWNKLAPREIPNWPSTKMYELKDWDTYRDINYVKKVTNHLAEQLAGINHV